MYGSGGTNAYSKDPYTEWYNPPTQKLSILAEANNNVLGVSGNPAWTPVAEWGDTYGKKPDDLMFPEWQAKGFDVNSQMLYNEDASAYLNGIL
jgi:hypothetical protein